VANAGAASRAEDTSSELPDVEISRPFPPGWLAGWLGKLSGTARRAERLLSRLRSRVLMIHHHHRKNFNDSLKVRFRNTLLSIQLKLISEKKNKFLLGQ